MTDIGPTDVPNQPLTDTGILSGAGMPMSQYSTELSPNTYAQVMRFFAKKRSDSFTTGASDHHKPYTATDIGNTHRVNFTKNPAGKELPRGLSAVGNAVGQLSLPNAMEKFKDDIKLEQPKKNVSRGEEKPKEKSIFSLRTKGISEYRKHNGE